MQPDFDLIDNELGQLVLKRPGEDDVVDVRPRQAFPWTKAGTMVSVRTNAGKEVLLIEELASLPAALRERIERWMAANSFLPQILRIASVNNDFGYQMWDVTTDRGPAKFRVQEREDVRFLNDGRFSIKDTDGNIYVMPPLDALDADSQRAVKIVL
ncbi:MAG: Domain of uncharacterized function [Phycisphaerales bacterium]|nr:Domain of uncharacterized function [Phycisphaerales bacterium]